MSNHHTKRFGEHSRRNPEETAQIWSEFDRMADEGAIKPVVYARPYRGLQDISKVFEDMEARKVWGRAVISVLDLEPDAEDANRSKI